MLHLGTGGQQLQSMPGALGRSRLFPEWSVAPLFSLWTWSPWPPTTELHPICPAGRTLSPNPDAGRIFKEFVMGKMPQTGRVIIPPHAGRREFPPFPLSPLSSPRLVLWIFLLYKSDHMNSIIFHSSSRFALLFVPLQKPVSWSKIPSATSECCRVHAGSGSWAPDRPLHLRAELSVSKSTPTSLLEICIQ